MNRFVTIKFFVSVCLLSIILYPCSADTIKKKQNIDKLFESLEDSKQKFALVNPLSGHKLKSFSNTEDYIEKVASDVLYLQKASISFAEEDNQTNFIKRQIHSIFETTNTSIYQSIVITKLIPELCKDAIQHIDVKAQAELNKIRKTNLKSDVLDKSVLILKSRLIILAKFIQEANNTLLAQKQTLFKLRKKLRKIPVDAFSGRIQMSCLTLLDRMMAQSLRLTTLLNRVTDQIDTAIINIKYLNDSFFQNTPKGGLQSVVASYLAKIRRDLKFAIYQLNRHIKHSYICFEGISKDISDFKERLIDLAKALDLNRHHIDNALHKKANLLFDLSGKRLSLKPLYGSTEAVFEAVNKLETQEKWHYFKNYINSMLELPINFKEINLNKAKITNNLSEKSSDLRNTDKIKENKRKLDN